MYVCTYVCMYVSSIYEETSFVHLRKFCTLWAVTAKRIRYYTSLVMKLNLSKMHCTTYEIVFLFWCFREWILNC